MTTEVQEPVIDSRFGIIRALRETTLHPDLPQVLRCSKALLADTSRISPWRSDPVGAGCHWGDASAARAAAVGEAIERYCGNLVPSGLVRASYHELASTSRRAVDPDSVALFSPDQYHSPGFPFTPLTRDLSIAWVEGRDMLDHEPVLVPASLVYVSFFGRPTVNEPVTNPIIYAGLAAHRSREAAERAALLEVIERDAMTVAWNNRIPIPRLTIPDNLRRLFSGPTGKLRVHCYQFPSDFDVPVVGTFLEHATSGYLTLGTAAHPDPRIALLKASAEAVQLQAAAREIDDPNSYTMRGIRNGATSPLKPWRADRRYRDSYRADWRDVCDLVCQIQLYLDPAMRKPLSERLAGGPEVTLADLAVKPSPHATPSGYFGIAAAGLPLVSVDLTTADVAPLGWSVVRTVVPGTVSNSAAAFPFLGEPRQASRAQYPAHKQDHPALLPLPYA